MQYTGLIVATVLLAGCGTSTQVIDASWDDSVVREQVSEIGASGTGTVEVPQSRFFYSGGKKVLRSSDPVLMTEKFALRGDSLLWAGTNYPGLRLSQIGEVRADAGRDHKTGAQYGFLLGAVAGGAIGLVAGFAMMEDCDPNPFGIICDASLGDVLGRAAVLALVGGVAGTLLGAVAGAQKRTVYRFRAGTPQQMDVIVSLSPRVSQR